MSHFIQDRITNLEYFLKYTKKILKIIEALQHFIQKNDALFENKVLNFYL